jgi:hypothetical protein
LIKLTTMKTQLMKEALKALNRSPQKKAALQKEQLIRITKKQAKKKLQSNE